eukprot:gene12309-25892_t
MTQISEYLILRASGEYDCEVVTRLKLDQIGIIEINNLEVCESLCELSLAKNEITRISGLQTLLSLHTIDLSFNRIEHIENLEKLVNLKWLSLKGNRISNIDEINSLATLTVLRSFFMRDHDGSNANPACAHPSYGNTVSRILPKLDPKVLNRNRICLSEAANAIQNSLQAITASEDACKTPPLQPWLDGAIATGTGTGGLVPLLDDGMQNSNTSIITEAIERTKDMLNEECTHLLRQAQTAINKVVAENSSKKP